MNEHNSNKLLGKKDLSAILLPGKSSGISNSPATSQDSFKQFSSDILTVTNDSTASMNVQTTSETVSKQGISFMIGYKTNHSNCFLQVIKLLGPITLLLQLQLFA